MEEYKNKKLLEYKSVLDGQKEEFLTEKVALMVWMRKEEIECGKEVPSITTEMIEDAEKQLADHQEVLRRRVIIEDKSRNILEKS